MSPDHTAITDDGTSMFVKCPACGRLTWRNGTCAHGVVLPPERKVATGGKVRDQRVTCNHGVATTRYCRKCHEDDIDRRDQGGEG